MKSRSKPERKEHESMMKKIKKNAYGSENPQHKVTAKAGLKKVRSLKRGS